MRHGFGESTGGRPPALFQFKADTEYMLGVAVEIPSVHVVIIDLNGKIAATEYWKMDTNLSPEKALEDLATRLTSFVESHKSRASKISMCGAVLSGFLNRETGVSLATPRVPGWQNIPVRDYLSTRLAMPVVLNHHIDALMLAELACGAAENWSDFLYFDVGYGLGVRLVKAGRPVHGMFGNAGLIGHTTIVPNGRLCVCSNKGCLEEYVSLRALLRQLSALSKGLPAEPTLDHADDDVEETVGRLFAADDEGSATLQNIKRETCEYLSIGLANAVNIFDLPRVVLSGFVTRGSERFREQLLHAVRVRLQPPLAQAAEIVYATVPRTRAGALGAALFALQRRLPAAEPLIVASDLQKGGDAQTPIPIAATS